MPSDNESILEDLRRRVWRANLWRYFFIILMPVGLIVPCVIGMLLGKANPNAQGFTLAQAFGIAALALPIVGLAGWLLLGGDRKKYQEALAAAEEADALGYDFSEQPSKRLLKQLRSFRMFNDADDHAGMNCVSGKRGKSFALLEYRTAYHGAITPYDTKITMQTVVVVFGLDKDLPAFRLGPKTWLSKLLEVFGARTIELPDQQTFNRKFIVCGDHADSIRQAVTPEVVERMLESEGTLEVYDGALLFYRHNHLVEPQDYQDFIGEALRLAKTLCR